MMVNERVKGKNGQSKPAFIVFLYEYDKKKISLHVFFNVVERAFLLMPLFQYNKGFSFFIVTTRGTYLEFR